MRARWAGTAAVLGVALVGLGISWLALGPGRDANPVLAARAKAVAAAEQIAMDVTAYDYRTVDTQLRSTRSELTGQALQDFVAREATVRDAVTSRRLVSNTEVLDSATVSNTVDTATVLVSAQIRFVSGGPDGSGARDALLEIHLTRRGDVWVADLLPALP